MNICHIITRLIVGGAQENTLLTCEELRARGHRVSLITGPEVGPEGCLLEEAHADGYEVYVLPSLRRAVHPWRDLRAKGDLARQIKSVSPDIVHTHTSKAGILARIAAREAGVPRIVHTIHGASFNRTQSWVARALYRALEKHCASFTDRIVTVADAMTAQMLAAGIAPPEKFITIYSGIRTDWFSPERYDRAAVRKRWGFDDDAIIVGAIARLFHNKGYEQLIPAMADAVRQCPHLRFVWVGDGAQRVEYERQLIAMNLRSHVHLTGLVRPREVAQVLAGVDMLVHASQWEGLPRAAVQALLMERPVISFDIDGAPEVVIPGQTGILVPLKDTQTLGNAMVTLSRDADMRKRFGGSGRELCLGRFDHQVMVDRIEQLYTELMGRRQIRPVR